MRRRIELWLRMLETGVKPLDTAARWIAVVTLLLGIAGITVTFVLHLSWPLVVIILMSVLLAVVLEGAYRIWYLTDQERLSAEAARDASQRELQAQQGAHEEQIASLRAPQPGSSPQSGLEAVITNEVPTSFPGLALILEIEYTVTNHDAMEHMLSVSAQGPLFFPPVGKQRDPEYLEILHTSGRISERRRREAPPRVRPGETVRGVYVIEFAWNPERYLPDYTLVVSDGRQKYEVRPGRVDTDQRSLEPRYLQREPYRLPNANMIHHRIGIRNPPGNPEAVSVRLQWIDMSPRPHTDLGYPPVIPQAVPMQAGGDPTIGITLPPGQEELWVIATTATDEHGVMTVGVFGPRRFGWHGTPWQFEPRDRWRFTYRIVADSVTGRTISVVMHAVDGQVRCELEG